MLNFCTIVRDRPRLTKQGLESLELHTDMDQLTVTIVDDQSEEETADYLFDWTGKDTKKRHLSRINKSKGTGWARNKSIEISEKWFGRGEFLYIADNDAYYTEHWLSYLLEAWPVAKENGFKILGAYNHPFQGPVPSTDPIPVPNVGQIFTYYAVGTLSWLVEWETLDAYGKFDDHALGVRKSEDWAFCQRIIKDGFKVGALSPHRVHHTGRTDTFGGKDPGANYIPDISGVIVE